MQIAALKALKLNIRRAKVKTKGDTKVNKFYITDATTAEKVMKVLHTVLLNMLYAFWCVSKLVCQGVRTHRYRGGVLVDCLFRTLAYVGRRTAYVVCQPRSTDQ